MIRTIEYKWNIDRRENIEILKDKYNVETLLTRRKRSLLKIMYKQSLDVTNIDTYRPTCNLRSRNKVRLKAPFTRITKIQKSPFYIGVNLWNALPQDLQIEENMEKFKTIINGYKFEK